MNIEILKEIAKLRGIDVNTDSQTELIRRMQVKEGNQPCYGTKKFECHNVRCMWFRECQGLIHIVEVK